MTRGDREPTLAEQPDEAVRSCQKWPPVTPSLLQAQMLLSDTRHLRASLAPDSHVEGLSRTESGTWHPLLEGIWLIILITFQLHAPEPIHPLPRTNGLHGIWSSRLAIISRESGALTLLLQCSLKSERSPRPCSTSSNPSIQPQGSQETMSPYVSLTLLPYKSRYKLETMRGIRGLLRTKFLLTRKRHQ